MNFLFQLNELVTDKVNINSHWFSAFIGLNKRGVQKYV